MADILSAAISGFRAATQRIGIAANNISNLNTSGYKKIEPIQTEDLNSGVKVSIKESTSSSSTASVSQKDKGPNSPEVTGPSNVDIAEEMAELIMSKYTLTANIKVIQTMYDNLGSVIDIKG